MERREYACDTKPYWCPEDIWTKPSPTFGRFIEEGRAYEILNPDTPRPWLNYLCNERFASAISNRGLGFTWYKTSLLRITKYEHPIDYLPREFEDGRDVVVTDLDSGVSWNVFRETENLNCIHRTASTTLTAKDHGLEVEMVIFVPLDAAAECWTVRVRNAGAAPRRLSLSCRQVWTFSRFGIHTAEEGIPYLSTPGEGLEVWVEPQRLLAHTADPKLPLELWGVMQSPQADSATVEDDTEVRPDGRTFVFKKCALDRNFELEPGASAVTDVLSGADDDERRFNTMIEQYSAASAFSETRKDVEDERADLSDRLSCQLPDTHVEYFLNTWLKHQLYLTFRFVRSGYIGYRDTLQDAWGWMLLDPDGARKQILRTLKYMNRDGSCPRNYSPVGDDHDVRRFMDSGTWLAMALVDLIRETGEIELLDEPVSWLDESTPASVGEHLVQALDLLFEQRGRHGLCLTGDGDWNDALEGISRCGDAESAWLTMALFHAQNLTALLFRRVGRDDEAQELERRSQVLKEQLNTEAWDGDWYVYGFTGSGAPIGSKSNAEGRIHLNAQTWAIFTGLANEEQIAKMQVAMREQLDTPLGPTLLSPPYADEADEVGRIADLEPGTFENASIYQHAVTFRIFADIAAGRFDEAASLFSRLLPTNPDNPDSHRTSEPYCTGNFYCGPGHKRFGQNFFTWFTGNAAWLLRAGFDEILGVKADFDGLRVQPKVPSDWDSYQLTRTYRGTRYQFNMRRSDMAGIVVDGRAITGNLIPPSDRAEVQVEVTFC